MGELYKVITAQALSFSYGNMSVLTDVSASIDKGKLTVILGKNGSGKSTFLRLIAGLMPYKHGQILVNGKDLNKTGLKQRARIFGFLGQKHKAIFPFTVREVVLTGRVSHVNITPGSRDLNIVENVLSTAGILHLSDRIYSELSGGEQQLVMIARVLAQQPQILLLDEPTTHLDFCNQIKLLSLLKNLTTAGLTVVAVLHDPNIAFLYGDDFLFVKDGNIIKPEEPTKPWDAEFLQSIYKCPIQSIPYATRAIIIPDLT
jgi:iron complex transport system ATP-binding protein